MNKNEMTPEREGTILEAAIEKWGERLQITVAIEELSELQKALCKYLRWASVTEDGEGREKIVAPIKEAMADASIMLNQLELIFSDCSEEEIAKLERLEKLVGLTRPATGDGSQTLCHQDSSGRWVLNDLPPTVRRWAPEDVRAVEAIKRLYPKAQYIVRAAKFSLVACELLAPSANGWYAEFGVDICSALAVGYAASIDDILAEGGEEV